MANSLPRLTVNDLSPTSDTGSPVDPTGRKLTLLRKIRPPPFRYAWSCYHEKHAMDPSTSYDKRLTLLSADIITVKDFWQVLNSFPINALGLKDSFHFFKRGVKPIWEDRRNIDGGAWTFRVPKAKSEQFFKDLLLMGVGEQFADVIQPGDDLCGISISTRFNSSLVSVWNRRGDNEKSREGILRVIKDQVSPSDEYVDLFTGNNFYYKRHSEHAGFAEVVAKARESEKPDDNDKITEAEVKASEGDQALLKEAEGIDVKDL